MKRKTTKQLQAACDSFNRDFPVGTPVLYVSVFPSDGDPGTAPVPATVREPATILSGHTAVAWLDGVRGCVAVDHVLRVPE